VTARRQDQPVADAPAYEIEFYEDDNGHEPALEFMRSLSPVKRRAIGVALREVLQFLGPDVAEGNFGKNLGEGLFEFRLDQDAEQILRRKGKDARPEPDEEKILLRVFFHPHGGKLVLLLSGYDKGERPSKPYQQEQIEKALAHLKHWKERQKRGAAGKRKK
jgi:putative component of toxin-antitoxin plasmid stabilization module